MFVLLLYMVTDGVMEESRVPDSGLISGPSSEDEAVQEARSGREAGRGKRRSKAEGRDSEVALRSVSEVLEDDFGLKPIYGSDCSEGPVSGSGLCDDDSEAGFDAPEALPPITFEAFLGSGKTAVVVNVDGEATVTLQIHPSYLESVIELLRRRNRVLQVTIQ